MFTPLFICSIFLAYAERPVYSASTEYVFSVEYHDNDTTYSSFISMWTDSNSWDVQSNQKTLYYHFHRDSTTVGTWPIIAHETTGVIESSSEIWLHPPRDGRLSLLEYFPFPEIKKKNYKNRYNRYFIGNCDFIKRWIWLKYKMNISTNPVIFSWDNHYVPVRILRGKAKSKEGEWNVEYYYNDQLGFVYWYYNFRGDIIVSLILKRIIHHDSNSF